MLQYIILSFTLGILPEVIYYTLFLIYAKDIKEKKKRLFFGILLIYTALGSLFQYKLITFWGFIIITYLYLKILYKDTDIIDMLTTYLATSYLTVISYIGFMNFTEDLSNYYILFAINRILVVIPLLVKNKFHKIYQEIRKMWNRNDKEKRPVKSITLRVGSFIIINTIIFFMNHYLMLMMDFGN